jgi:hypothetical protein
MSPTHGTPEDANSAGVAQLAAKSRVIAAADANEVMLEQLEYLIEHTQGGDCGCAQCDRYWRARAVIMEIFTEAPRPVAVRKSASSRN